MALADRLRQQVTRFRPEDRPALIEFQREVFGPGARQLDEQHFEWLFYRNPFRQDDDLPIWLFRKDGKVIGQQSGIPFELKVGNQFFHASWAIDLRVHPDWHLRGVGPVLTEALTASSEITVGLGITDAAYKAFRRAGWIDIGFIPTYIRLLDIHLLAKARWNGRPLARVAGVVGNSLLRIADTFYYAYERCKGAILEPVERFDERVDALWAAASACYPAIARRDLHSLRWRFDTLPDAGRYQRHYVHAKGGLRGYVVTRMGAWHDEKVGHIVDYLAAPHDVLSVFACTLESLRSQGAAAAYCTTLNPAARLAMYALGFLPRPPDVHLMVRVGTPDSALAGLAGGVRNWFITVADSDQDHRLGGA